VQPVSVAILAGGQSGRFKPSKALTKVAGKPLFLHVVDACEGYADEIFIVVHSEVDRELFSVHYPQEQIITDIPTSIRCPLVGALTAFHHAQNPYTQLLPCDSPLIHDMFFEIMWSMVEDHHAAVPRWPNGWVEPLHSVFATEIGQDVASRCLEKQQPRMQCLINNIGRVIYLSTNALARFDSKLLTFANVNTPNDLHRIEQSLRKQHRRQ
jgi:molybdopterin-guanine dinucleotide biosynthesis protein A